MSNGRNGKGKSNGRDKRGKFTKGNQASVGRGNPLAERVHHLRGLFYSTVDDEALRAIILKVVEEAKAGDMMAAREILGRMIGKPADAIDAEKLVEKLVVRDECNFRFTEAVLANAATGRVTPDLLKDTLDGE